MGFYAVSKSHQVNVKADGSEMQSTQQ